MTFSEKPTQLTRKVIIPFAKIMGDNLEPQINIACNGSNSNGLTSSCIFGRPLVISCFECFFPIAGAKLGTLDATRMMITYAKVITAAMVRARWFQFGICQLSINVINHVRKVATCQPVKFIQSGCTIDCEVNESKKKLPTPLRCKLNKRHFGTRTADQRSNCHRKRCAYLMWSLWHISFVQCINWNSNGLPLISLQRWFTE